MHYISTMPGGAECSCGKVFRYPPKYGMDSVRMTNMALGNARRHAEAQNKREVAEKEAANKKLVESALAMEAADNASYFGAFTNRKGK